MPRDGHSCISSSRGPACSDGRSGPAIADGLVFGFVKQGVHPAQVGCFFVPELVGKRLEEIIDYLKVLLRELLAERFGCALLLHDLLLAIGGQVFLGVSLQEYLI
jgi:hypothetical protein